MEENVLYNPKWKYNYVGLHNLCYEVYYSMCSTWPQMLIPLSFQDNHTWAETNHCHYTFRLKRGPRYLLSLFLWSGDNAVERPLHTKRKFLTFNLLVNDIPSFAWLR